VTRRRLVLALVSGLVCTALACGRYGPPKRYPAPGQAVEQPEPPEEAAEDPERDGTEFEP
jgi:hypothetical protein